MMTTTKHPALAPQDLRAGDILDEPGYSEWKGWIVHSSLQEDGGWTIWLAPPLNSSVRQMYDNGTEPPTGIVAFPDATFDIQRQDA